ncbi:MAG: 8-oxo-dGTP diphosphatase [Myxococcota bacterium]|nr:8-oxo-dGTP diphosphatase [Myxococcota bacterium]
MNSSGKLRSIGDVEWANWLPVDRATLTFIVHEDQILLIRKKRGLGAGKINGPGGRLEPGETVRDCAVREVQEELCITPVGLIESGQLRFQFLDGYSIHVTVYRAESYLGEPSETDEAIPMWFRLDEIPYAEMWEDDLLWIPKMLAGKPIGGRFLFDEDRMLDYVLDEELR